MFCTLRFTLSSYPPQPALARKKLSTKITKQKTPHLWECFKSANHIIYSKKGAICFLSLGISLAQVSQIIFLFTPKYS